MFSKILIANRGEIACRVIKTARKMGIATVAVYSDADADGLHVQMADEAVHIGPAPASESYLVTDNILAAIKQSGAEAVHPGYGFLSENAGFAEALAAAGVAFIGPNVGAIRVMGDKIESKRLADDAGVTTVPGVLGVIKDTEEAVKIATDIGFPVMIKASAGGGGKGMRVAWSADEVAQGFESSMNEARSSFGDDRVFIEKYIEEPRHIEIQVLADKKGNTIYLGERECSIQRRHQKVIEEAPSPFLDKSTRKAMGEEAIALARAVQYESAGTVEFIVDKDRNFYFLEMNTRLQVEHPVTELITGIDLVEQMIRVAAGEEITIRQKDVKLNGWAMESRIYAEDPYRNFLPSIGRLVRYQPPQEEVEAGLTIRNDTGVYEGSEISLYYDPMIAKLCTHGPDRASAIDHMSRALDDFYIDGIRHNIPFLASVMGASRFREGNITTNYIAEEFPDGFHGAEAAQSDVDKLIAVAAWVHDLRNQRAAMVDGQLWDDSRDARPVRHDWVASAGDTQVNIRFSEHRNPLTVEFMAADGETPERSVDVDSTWVPGDPVFRGTVGAESICVAIKTHLNAYAFAYRGAQVRVRIERPRMAEFFALMPETVEADTSKYLLCPMPGLVVSIAVEEGQEIKAGETLAVVEAMKMENVLRAERDGVIEKINCAAGDSLAVDDIILEFEAESAVNE